ncbi:protein-L-isoaspartate(D-aspartate) O-methyltransferase [Sphingomonas sp. SORGH_AS870]|uniref:protein-L-isoaspartate O-methyltransferase family protein n=1 Tax=Sphingomonas sp. SORGH_AS_0870 TaxID=3041801 RepID=UPI00285EE39B|nr:protein-L-isoaspartate O-methyltransferase [Sphingomonas sp. SORGH_AS_0870]MDR6145984.1 protein-L-isoaspartate(D-aspartate) O-methyltransferase [Sphingomonas sp. SORGH_AS_0870]
MMTISNDSSNFDAMRHAMVVSQLRTTAVSDQRVVAAMARVPRETFVPEALRPVAYRDGTLDLGQGRAINLPMATGRLLTEAYLEAGDRVLLIGAATGYTATLLAEIVAEVVAVEEQGDLVAAARTALAGQGKVTLAEGPLKAGHAAGAPYDVLIVDGAVEELPAALVEQVKVDGRIVTGLVENGVTRLASGRRTEGGHGVRPFADAECTILPGFARPRAFQF